MAATWSALHADTAEKDSGVAWDTRAPGCPPRSPSPALRWGGRAGRVHGLVPCACSTRCGLGRVLDAGPRSARALRAPSTNTRVRNTTARQCRGIAHLCVYLGVDRNFFSETHPRTLAPSHPRARRVPVRFLAYFLEYGLEVQGIAVSYARRVRGPRLNMFGDVKGHAKGQVIQRINNDV